MATHFFILEKDEDFFLIVEYPESASNSWPMFLSFYKTRDSLQATDESRKHEKRKHEKARYNVLDGSGPRTDSSSPPSSSFSSFRLSSFRDSSELLSTP
jgi:hypothetical protein